MAAALLSSKLSMTSLASSFSAARRVAGAPAPVTGAALLRYLHLSGRRVNRSFPATVQLTHQARNLRLLVRELTPQICGFAFRCGSAGQEFGQLGEQRVNLAPRLVGPVSSISIRRRRLDLRGNKPTCCLRRQIASNHKKATIKKSGGVGGAQCGTQCRDSPLGLSCCR